MTTLLGRRLPEEEEVDVSGLLWLTYRCGFAEMVPYGYSDDAGWGCMLRSCQMLLSNALLRHGSGRDEVVKWFADAPGDDAIFSIHNMVRVGQRYDVLPGEWYGPGVASHVLRELCDVARVGMRLVVTSAENPLCRESVLDSMSRHVREEVRKVVVETPREESNPDDYDPLLRPPPEDSSAALAEAARVESRRKRLEESEWIDSLMLVVPIRLGLERLEEKYADPLLACLDFPQSVGLVGGRPRQALYFPGRRGSSLVGLDPHVVQPSPGLGPGLLSEKHNSSMRCLSPRFIQVKAIDPSLALAFYCRNREDFVDLVGRAELLSSLSTPPIFDVLQHQTKKHHLNANAFDADSDDDDDGGNRREGDRRLFSSPEDEDDVDYVVV